MIEIRNLTKIYKLNKKQMKESKTTNPLKTAVDDLSLRDRMEQGRQLRCVVFPRSSVPRKGRFMWPGMKCRKNRSR